MTDQTFAANNETLTLMENLPVFITTIHPEFSVAKNWAAGEADIRGILDAQGAPVFFIIDIREMKLSLEDLIGAANIGSRGQDPIWHHPKIRGVYFVTSSRMVEVAVKGLNTPVFGNMSAKVLNTLEKALEDIERVLASES